MKLAETDKAYLAGLIDGEGCVSIRKWKDKGKYFGYTLCLDIANSNPKLVKWIVENFGGKIYSYKFKNPNHKIRHDWRIYHQRAADILLTVLPYLVIKKTQALLAIEFRDTFYKGKTAESRADMVTLRERIIAQMHILNNKGNRQKFPDAPVLDKEDIMVFSKVNI